MIQYNIIVIIKINYKMNWNYGPDVFENWDEILYSDAYEFEICACPAISLLMYITYRLINKCINLICKFTKFNIILSNNIAGLN